jgi:hypothetical protein
VANIEDYTVLVESSYTREGIRGTSHDHRGWYYECVQPATNKTLQTHPCHGELYVKPINCHPDLKCPFNKVEEEDDPPVTSGMFLQTNASVSRHTLRGKKNKLAREVLHIRKQPAKSERMNANEYLASRSGVTNSDVFAIPSGDVFRLEKLLQLAGLDLDASRYHKKPLRSRGGRITIQVEYTNLRPWSSALAGDQHVGYIYRVVTSPIKQMKREVFSQNQPADDTIREIENQHGILFEAKVTGSFGVFNIVYLLVMLTTSLALLGGAKAFVDILAIYLPSSNQQAYTDAKYQYVGIELEVPAEKRST